MPAPCTCGTSCNCTIVGDGFTTAVSGSGTLADPYRIEAFEDTDFPGSPVSPLTSATATRPALQNVWWRTSTMPTRFRHSTDVQLNAAGYLSAPAGITASPVVGAATTIGWTAVAGASSYLVEVFGYVGGNGSPELPRGVIASVTSNGTTATVSALLSSNSYGVQVTARDATGLSAPSPELRFTAAGGSTGGPPAVPTGLAVVPSQTSATVTWQTVPRAVRYLLEVRAAGVVDGWFDYDSEFASYELAPLTPATAYEVRVAAVNAEGQSAFTTPVAFTTPTSVGAPPVAPQGLAVVAGATSSSPPQAAWSAVAGATSYLLMWQDASGVGGSASTVSTSLAVSGLVTGRAYTFRVYALNAYGTSSPSAPVTYTPVAAPAVPGAASVISAYFEPFYDCAPFTCGGVHLMWVVTNVGGSPVTAHGIERQAPGSSDWVAISSQSNNGANSVELIDANLPTSGTYRYRHLSVNSAGASPYSYVDVQVTLSSTGGGGTPPPVTPTPTQFPAPTGLGVASYLGGGLRFFWTAMTGATGYTGTVSGGGRTETINTFATDFIFNNPVAGVTYVLAVRAHYPGGQSELAQWSTTGGPVTPPPTTPTTPTGSMPRAPQLWDPTVARSAIAAATTLDGVVAAWNANVKARFGVGLRLAVGGESAGVTAAGPEDLPVVRGMMMSVCKALSYLPPLFFQQMTIDFIDYVICGTWPGVYGIYIGQNIYLPVDYYTGQTTADADSNRNFLLAMHETSHAITIGAKATGVRPAPRDTTLEWFDYTSNGVEPRADWLALNPAPYVPGGWNDTWASNPGFASFYGQSAYVEDLAECCTILFDTTYDGLPARLATDTALKAKMRLVIGWMSKLGLTAFNSLVNL